MAPLESAFLGAPSSALFPERRALLRWIDEAPAGTPDAADLFHGLAHLRDAAARIGLDADVCLVEPADPLERS